MQVETTALPRFLARQPERAFLGFLEAAPDAVVIIDGGGLILQVNGRTENLFGYGREELIGQPLAILMPERYRDSHADLTRTYMVDPRPRQMGGGLGLFGIRKDGSEFPIDVSISPLPPENGAVFASIIRDMTAHVALEEELRLRNVQLEEADRQKDNFLAAVAHELRSPLTVLSLVAQQLKLPPQDATRHAKTLVRLEHQTAHMARLIEDLLDMTKVRCGTFTLRREVVDLRSAMDDAVDMAQPLIDGRGHRLEVVPVREPLWVEGDATRLVEILSNLLNNAATYTPMGGHIRMAAEGENDAVVVRIRDDGIGIPKDMLSRVFELFTRADPIGGNGAGLGIGLALVRRLVELHGGTVHATSDGVDRGSEFVVRLPVSLTARNVAAPPTPDAVEAVFAVGPRSRRIS